MYSERTSTVCLKDVSQLRMVGWQGPISENVVAEIAK